MAYNCRTGQCDNISGSGCSRIQRFSNPHTLYEGRALGNAANDNARQLSDQLATVAGHFPAMDCELDSECDDAQVNTADTCNTETRVCVFTPIPTESPSSHPTATASSVPSGQPSMNPSSSPSSHPSMMPTNRPSMAPTQEPSLSPSSKPSKLPTEIPSAVPTTAPSSSPSQTPSALPSDKPSSPSTGSPSVVPTAAPSSGPSQSPSVLPSEHPSANPSHSPSAGPTSAPSSSPSKSPSQSPSRNPSAQPSAPPSVAPTAAPSSSPSSSPTKHPTTYAPVNPRSEVRPTDFPSVSPSRTPTTTPSAAPSSKPSSSPSQQPTVVPSADPTQSPSSSPSNNPSALPTSMPSANPSQIPSVHPSAAPSEAPSQNPSHRHSAEPSSGPTAIPSAAPTLSMSEDPTASPSNNPTSNPSAFPNSIPSSVPSQNPSVHPSASPSVSPSQNPSHGPAAEPSPEPTVLPSAAPTLSMSEDPTTSPSETPSEVPSLSPTAALFESIPPAYLSISPHMETLRLSNVGSESWTPVTFQKSFSHPVAVCTVDYGVGNAMKPAVVRMTDVTSDSLAVRLQNPSGEVLDPCDVHCVVVEQGLWTLPNGRSIEAQSYLSTKTNGKGNWNGERQTYISPTKYRNPVVVGQVMSYNDERWSTFFSTGYRNRHMASRNIIKTGKHVGEDVKERADETVGFIVMDAVHGNMQSDMMEFEATSGRRRVRGYVSVHSLQHAWTQTTLSSHTHTFSIFFRTTDDDYALAVPILPTFPNSTTGHCVVASRHG